MKSKLLFIFSVLGFQTCFGDYPPPFVVDMKFIPVASQLSKYKLKLAAVCLNLAGSEFKNGFIQRSGLALEISKMFFVGYLNSFQELDLRTFHKGIGSDVSIGVEGRYTFDLNKLKKFIDNIGLCADCLKNGNGLSASSFLHEAAYNLSNYSKSALLYCVMQVPNKHINNYVFRSPDECIKGLNIDVVKKLESLSASLYRASYSLKNGLRNEFCEHLKMASRLLTEYADVVYANPE